MSGKACSSNYYAFGDLIGSDYVSAHFGLRLNKSGILRIAQTYILKF